MENVGLDVNCFHEKMISHSLNKLLYSVVHKDVERKIKEKNTVNSYHVSPVCTLLSPEIIEPVAVVQWFECLLNEVVGSSPACT